MYIFSGIENYNATENDDKKFKFNFSNKNTSKYDSSDDENKDADDILHADEEMVDGTENENYANKLFGACYKDTLFFDADDVRFNGMIMEMELKYYLATEMT